MKLLRTRDNPEYKYTLAFLGGSSVSVLMCLLLATLQSEQSARVQVHPGLPG